MTRELTEADLRVERDRLLEGGRTLEQVERMQCAAAAGALLADHGADLAEAYYLLCAVMGWTYVMDSLSPKHDILRVARAIAESKPGPYGGEPVGELDEYERKAVRRPFLPPKSQTATSTYRPQEETPDSPGGCIRCGATEHEPCDAGLHG